jgi:streptomycin 6-kinase
MDFSSPSLEATRQRLVARFGTFVDSWWKELPDLLAALSHRWSLALEEPVGRGNTSLVIRCVRRDGTPAILKLVPDRQIAHTEGHALLAWQRSGRAPSVYEADFEAGALLMEAIPGETSLEEASPQGFLGEVTRLIQELHDCSPNIRAADFESLESRVDFMFRRTAERLAGMEGATGAVTSRDLEASHRLAHRLAAEPPRSVLLHGDLHAGNILMGGSSRGLVAIDPRPCFGDAAWDAIDYVFWPDGTPAEWLNRRDQLAQSLDCDRDRLLDWCRSVATVIAVGKLARGGTADDVAPLLQFSRTTG